MQWLQTICIKVFVLICIKGLLNFFFLTAHLASSIIYFKILYEYVYLYSACQRFFFHPSLVLFAFFFFQFHRFVFCSALVGSFFTAGIPEQISFYTLLQLCERSIISVLGLAAAAFLITPRNLTARSEGFESYNLMEM